MKVVESIQIERVIIPTPDGQMPAFLYRAGTERQPVVLLLMEAFGLTSHIQDIAARIAKEGYAVLAPDLYYRELPNNTFGYDEVEKAMAMMYRLDFGEPMENDLRAALAYVKSRADVYADKIGVTGFCLGGGLSFLAACKLSDEIAAAAPFYGMVLDEWIEEMTNIAVPMYLFFGGADPFIGRDRIQQIESRFEELGKEYALKVYPDANHGFFCHERSSYDLSAAEDAWHELTRFFHNHLQGAV
jgi:carboxymethylenebutenolidase